MELFDLNAVSVLGGLSAVILVAFFRLHWPFRFQYIATFFRNRPTTVNRLLDTSFHKNRSRPVAMLDKSTQEIMAGNYEEAEKYIAQGLAICKENRTIFNQAMIHYLFYNLATVYFYSGKYKDALNVAFRVFERDRGLTNALGVIVCAYARLGQTQYAVEAFQLMPKRRLKSELRLFCLAEIEASKGNYALAIDYLRQLGGHSHALTMYLNPQEIEKRLKEWAKALSQVG